MLVKCGCKLKLPIGCTRLGPAQRTPSAERRNPDEQSHRRDHQHREDAQNHAREQNGILSDPRPVRHHASSSFRCSAIASRQPTGSSFPVSAAVVPYLRVCQTVNTVSPPSLGRAPHGGGDAYVHHRGRQYGEPLPPASRQYGDKYSTEPQCCKYEE
jgi:hypothetical protein